MAFLLFIFCMAEFESVSETTPCTEGAEGVAGVPRSKCASFGGSTVVAAGSSRGTLSYIYCNTTIKDR